MSKKYVDETLAYWDTYDKKVFKSSDLSYLYLDLQLRGKIPKSLSLSSYIKTLIQVTDLKIENISFPRRTEKRFLLSGYSVYELVLSLRNGAYLSHKTAACLHGFIDTSPKDIYLNYEQSPKPTPKGELTQASIDIAFRNTIRTSKNKATFGEKTVYILSGKYTNRLGTIDLIGPLGEKIKTTNIERTLIDIAVRPNYAGGVENVSQIYKKAAEIVSIDKLLEILFQLKYIYPYHQVVGFYFDRTGLFSDKEIEIFRKWEMKFDFYLVHNIQTKKYSPKWMLYYPAELD